jgi:hypothetical protein
MICTVDSVKAGGLTCQVDALLNCVTQFAPVIAHASLKGLVTITSSICT